MIRTKPEAVSLLQRLEDRYRRLTGVVDRAMRERKMLQSELTRLRTGQSEAETVARLTGAGVRLRPNLPSDGRSA